MMILIMKAVALIFMFLAAVLSVKNYFMTRFASGVCGPWYQWPF